MAGPQADGSLFWELPVELRFNIYGLAYGTECIIVPKCTAGLIELKTVSRKLTAVKQTLQSEHDPKNVREVRLVNRQFYAESMQHFAENNTFELHRRHTSLDMVSAQFALNICTLVLV